MSEATDEKDLDPAIAVFRECILTRKKIVVIAWAHTVEEGRQDKWLLEMPKKKKSDSSNLEIYSV